MASLFSSEMTRNVGAWRRGRASAAVWLAVAVAMAIAIDAALRAALSSR